MSERNGVLEFSGLLRASVSQRFALTSRISGHAVPAKATRYPLTAAARPSILLSMARKSKDTKADSSSAGRRPIPHAKPPPLLDTRVIYCGDNLEQLPKLPNTCADRTKGFFVSFDVSGDAITEIGAFFRKTGKAIIALPSARSWTNRLR